MNNKFHFLPMRKRERIVGKRYVRFEKNGCMTLSRSVVQTFGIRDQAFVELFADVENRVIGFRFFNKAELGKNLRIARMQKNGIMMISISSFLNQLVDVDYAQATDIEEHVDPIYGKLYYAKVPKLVKEKIANGNSIPTE